MFGRRDFGTPAGWRVRGEGLIIAQCAPYIAINGDTGNFRSVSPYVGGLKSFGETSCGKRNVTENGMICNATINDAYDWSVCLKFTEHNIRDAEVKELLRCSINGWWQINFCNLGYLK